MMTRSRQTAREVSLRRLLRMLAAFWLLFVVTASPRASDHGDTPFLVGLGAHEARLTGFHAFTRGDRLVLALSSNPAIPSSVTSYEFPANLIFEILIDNNSPVSVDDPLRIGGTVLEPSRIREDHIFRITFDDHTPRVQHLPRSGRPQGPGIAHHIDDVIDEVATVGESRRTRHIKDDDIRRQAGLLPMQTRMKVVEGQVLRELVSQRQSGGIGDPTVRCLHVAYHAGGPDQ